MTNPSVLDREMFAGRKRLGCFAFRSPRSTTGWKAENAAARRTSRSSVSSRPFVADRQLVFEAQDASGLDPDYCLVAAVRGQLILTPPSAEFSSE